MLVKLMLLGVQAHAQVGPFAHLCWFTHKMVR